MLTRDQLIDAIGGIDTDLVEEFVRADNRLQAKKTRRVSLNVRFVALAACFALIFVSLPPWRGCGRDPRCLCLKARYIRRRSWRPC